MIPKIPPINPETKKDLYREPKVFQRVEQYLLEDETLRNNTQKYFNLSEQQSAEVVEVIENGEDLGKVENDVKGLVYDAKAIAIMFHTDFYAENRINRLEKALAFLGDADKYRRKDWAIYCNFGSINMRLGYWRKFKVVEGSGNEYASKNFREAHRYLDEVINELRPGYGFALYEKGRAYRLEGDFTNAIECFKESLAVPKNRDVSDRRLEFEIWRP
jgi:tetratricopeptide (TPR) repeat protein